MSVVRLLIEYFQFGMSTWSGSSLLIVVVNIVVVDDTQPNVILGFVVTTFVQYLNTT